MPRINGYYVRPEEREKARKRAASACKSIDVMFAAKRQKTEESENRFSVDRENTIVASESANSGSACLNLQSSPKTTPLLKRDVFLLQPA